MKNRIFGKTMESIRNHKDMKLVTSQEKYLKHVMKPSIKGGRPFSKELFALEIEKTDVEMIKAVYLCKAISEWNEKVIGIMKDKLGQKIMIEFVALRAKMYAYRNIDKRTEEKRSKGTTKQVVVAEGVTFDDCKTCLFDEETICMEQMLFEN